MCQCNPLGCQCGKNEYIPRMKVSIVPTCRECGSEDLVFEQSTKVFYCMDCVKYVAVNFDGR